MTTSPAPQNIAQKNKFQISNEVKDNFVNEIATSMLKLSKNEQSFKTVDEAKFDEPYNPEPYEPYSATTGYSYTGVNMARLMLSSIEKNHKDNRWITYKQLQSMKDNHPELNMNIRQGEKGVKILGSQEIKFIIKDNEEWEFPTDERIKELHNLQKQGVETPEIKKTMLFYPFTVFNAEQIEGFPPKKSLALRQSSAEPDNLDPFDLRFQQLAKIESFISSSGVKVKHHANKDSYYHPEKDVIKIPCFSAFENINAYTATKLRLFYAATGHAERENRGLRSDTYDGVASETMRGDMFSMLVSGRYGLPMPQNNSLKHIDNWNQKFAGGDTKNLFRAISDAAKIMTTMSQYELGEQPKTKWFPKKEEWAELELKAQGNHPDDIAQRENERTQIDAQKEKEVKVHQDEIALSAQKRWDGLPEDQLKGAYVTEEAQENHPYLLNRGISSFGLKQMSFLDSTSLIVPMQNIAGEIRGLQFLDEDGSKGFLEVDSFHDDNFDKSGIFHLINSENSQKNLAQAEILICEDYATGASLHMATNKPVVVAFDPYNLKPVAEQIREKYPDAKITICAACDFHLGEPGYYGVNADKSQTVANEVGGQVKFPTLSESDKKLGLSTFNDIHKTYGLEFLQKQMAVPSQNLGNSMTREEMDKAQTKDMKEIVETNRIKEVLNNPELLDKVLAYFKKNPDAETTNFNPELAQIENKAPRMRA